MTTVTIPKKALRQVMDVAKKAHTQNIEVSVNRGKVKFTMCENGEIRKGTEAGYKSQGKCIWHACEDCGKERWVQLCKGIPKNPLCFSCAWKRSGKIASQHPNWKGGRRQTEDGYIEIKISKGDFFCPMASVRGYIREHRLVVAMKLGRCLQRWELVHHLNGIRDDNRAENLALTMNQYHKKHTIEIALKGHVKVLENKIDRILEGQKELKQEIRLLRFENKELRERV